MQTSQIDLNDILFTDEDLVNLDNLEASSKNEVFINKRKEEVISSFLSSFMKNSDNNLIYDENEGLNFY